MKISINNFGRMMCAISIFIFSLILLSCPGGGGGTETGTGIIADHTVVDQYDKIPAEYMAKVKTMMVDIAGESHSEAYRTGIAALAALNTDYASLTFDGSIPAVSTTQLRLGRHASVGEQSFYTNATAISNIKTLITNQHNAGNPIHVLGFGWCWDMTWHSNQSSGGTNERDPVYNVHWYGSSEGNTVEGEGDYTWGLDSADKAITGNSVCMDTYINAVEAYRSHCKSNKYACEVIFTTGPVDGNNGSEVGFQREIKHDYIREYVKNHGGTFLFDYADILCYNNSNVPAEFTWTDGSTPRIHKGIHLDNDAEETGHIANTGALRLAKAMWWLLARISGWDGN